MKTILANDTSATDNPGCQGTMHCLNSGLEEAGHEILSRVPLGYGYPFFQNVLEEIPPPGLLGKLAFRLEHSNRLNRLGKWIFGETEPYGHRVSASAWDMSVQNIQEDFLSIIGDAEWLVVNGEGTIHDNTIGALTLVGLCRAARNMGLKVAIVNCSIFDLDPVLLDELKKVHYIAVREPLTFSYLSRNGIKGYQAADCLFLAADYIRADGRLNDLPGKGTGSYVVYTPGVLTGSGNFDKVKMAEELRSIIDLGCTVYYYVVEREDERYVEDAERAGAIVLPLGTMDWPEVAAFLSGAEFVVSGRYHILIYAYLAGTPFRPLASNTIKIEGLLKLLEISDDQKLSHAYSASVRYSQGILKSCVTIQPLKSLARLNLMFANY